MSIDSRAKGARFEHQIRKMLSDHTELEWLRVPGSGAFSASHALKGDVYLAPSTGKMSAWTIEAKDYADEVLTSNLFRATESQFEKFLAQTYREAEQMNAKPILVFKKTRGILLCAIDITEAMDIMDSEVPYMVFSKKDYEVVILSFENWLNTMKTEDLIK